MPPRKINRDFDQEKDLSLPVTRIKKVCKAALENGIQSSKFGRIAGLEATGLIAKAAELFLNDLTAKSGRACIRSGRSTLHYDDISDSVDSDGRLQFLAEIVPKKVPGRLVKQHQQELAQGRLPERKTPNPAARPPAPLAAAARGLPPPPPPPPSLFKADPDSDAKPTGHLIAPPPLPPNLPLGFSVPLPPGLTPKPDDSGFY